MNKIGDLKKRSDIARKFEFWEKPLKFLGSVKDSYPFNLKHNLFNSIIIFKTTSQILKSGVILKKGISNI